jgi:hypothetical protein
VGFVETFRFEERSVRDDAAVGAGVVTAFLRDARVLGGVSRARWLTILLLVAADNVWRVVGTSFISISCSTFEFLTIR